MSVTRKSGRRAWHPSRRLKRSWHALARLARPRTLLTALTIVLSLIVIIATVTKPLPRSSAGRTDKVLEALGLSPKETGTQSPTIDRLPTLAVNMRLVLSFEGAPEAWVLREPPKPVMSVGQPPLEKAAVPPASFPKDVGAARTDAGPAPDHSESRSAARCAGNRDPAPAVLAVASYHRDGEAGHRAANPSGPNA